MFTCKFSLFPFHGINLKHFNIKKNSKVNYYRLPKFAILQKRNCLFARYLFASLSMPLVIKEKEVFQGVFALFLLKKRSTTYKTRTYEQKNHCFFCSYVSGRRSTLSRFGNCPCHKLPIYETG